MPTDDQLVDRTVIEKLLLSVVPERVADLRGLWDLYLPEFWLRPDHAGLVLSAGNRRVRFTHRTMVHDWLVAFAGWKGFRLYGPVVSTAFATRVSLSPELLNGDPGREREQQSIQDVLYTARQIARQDVPIELVHWPEEVPRPAADGSAFPTEDRATYDLLCIATAGAFLHELKHLMFDRRHDRPARIEEERRCDIFARNFILEQVATYAAQVGHEISDVLGKRVMGLALTAYVIHEGTPHFDQPGSTEYPSTAERLATFTDVQGIPDNAYSWNFVSAIALSMLDSRGGLKATIEFENPKHLCCKLLEHLRAVMQ